MDAVINLKHEPALREKLDYHPVHNNTVLVDRRTKWGNPFKVGVHGTREQVIALFRAGKVPLAELAELDGKWLACHCAPLPCHGRVLARAAAWAASVLADLEAA